MTDKQILQTIGGNLKEARLKANMTQEGLAELIGIHWKTLGYIESGKRDFGVKHLAKIVLNLQITPEQVFSGLSLEPTPYSALVKKATVRKRKARG